MHYAMYVELHLGRSVSLLSSSLPSPLTPLVLFSSLSLSLSLSNTDVHVRIWEGFVCRVFVVLFYKRWYSLHTGQIHMC